VLRLDLFAVPRIDDRHSGRPAKDLGKHALAVRRQVVTTTKASPLPAGRDLKNCSSASTPPAEAPMPTMGRLGIMIITLRAYASFILLLAFTPQTDVLGLCSERDPWELQSGAGDWG
jgi:hypothetical protein